MPVTTFHRRAARRRLTNRVRRWYASTGKPSTLGTSPFFQQSSARCSSEMLKGSCSIARRCSRLKTLGTCSRMVLLVWQLSSGRASPCCAWKLSRTAWRTASGSLVRPPSGVRTAWMVWRPASYRMRLTYRRDLYGVSFLPYLSGFLGCGRYAVGVPFLKLVAAGREERTEVGFPVSCLWCAGAQQAGKFLFRSPDVMDELSEGEVRRCSRVAGVALHAACLCRPAHGGGECWRIWAAQDGV